MKEILIIVLSAVLVENFVLTKFLGICPFIGVSKRIHTAIGMGGAVIFVLTLSSAITKLVYDLLLEPYGLEYPSGYHCIYTDYCIFGSVF